MKSGKNVSLIAVLVLFLVFVSLCANAQKKVELINSLDLLKRGIALADSGSYDKAVALYEQISPNDTNYAMALFEEAASCISGSKDSLALIICQKGLELHSDYKPDFYKLMGSALIDLGKYDDAIKLMHKAIAKYPNVYLLHFTLGLAYYKSQNYDSAIAALEQSISLNIYHASSHYYLGKCCLEQGRMIPAVLSLQFCLVIEPLTTRSFSVVQLLEKVMENKYEYNKSNKVPPSKYNDGIFADLDLLVQSQAALNKGYKAKTKINYNVIKQCQLVLEKLSYTPNTNNFWMDTYAPFFTELEAKDFFEPYAHYIMQSVNDDKLQKDIKSEKKKIDKFLDWADSKIIAMRHSRDIIINGKKTQVVCYYYSNHLLQAMGLENTQGKQTGEWTIYHENDGTVAARGSFDDNGNRTGAWQWYYSDSTLKERTEYREGKKEGSSETRYDNGAIKGKYSYKNGMLNGEALEYNSSGIINTLGTYKDDKPIGIFTLYYADGKPHYTVNYGENGMEGEQKEFYVTGQLELSTLYQNSKKNGAMKEYWPGGKLKDEGAYKEDKPSGHWKFYYEDGSLQRESDYSDGNPVGTSFIYYRNGKKQEETPYDKDGKVDGPDIMYDYDGIKYGILDYKKDMLEHYIYLDKAGKTLSEGKLTGKSLHHESYYPSGIKHSEGETLYNKREGEWKFYSVTGALSITENYAYGQLNGKATNYYLNGKVKDSVYYENDEMEGYYVSYWGNGVMKSQGWYEAGHPEGDWYYYNLKGGVSSHNYYLDGEMHGYAEFYNPTGRMIDKVYYTNGYLDKDCVYDTNGQNIIYTYQSDKGNGHYLITYPNGQAKIDRTYMSGNAEGPEKMYYYDGKSWSDANFLIDKHQGLYKTYYDNGNPETMYNYDAGNLSGKAELYFRSGKIKVRENYLGGEEDGHYQEYYETGNLRREGQSQDGMSEGEYRYYSQDSLLYCVRRYHNEIVTEYSYLGKNGQLVPFIPLEKGTGDVKTFYANGNKSLECTYLNGSLQGRRVEYLSNGNVFEDENYELGNITGTQKYYYPSGKLKAEENYYMGEKDGQCLYYYENGKPEHEESWVLGYQQGASRYYDHNGNLLKTAVFYNNDEVSEVKK